MRFVLIDAILEQSSERIVALKHVSAAEECLQDHFPTFPVLPGVLMLEAMTQAARALVATADDTLPRLVLGEVRALKYGAFVKPGDTLRVEVDLLRSPDDPASPDAHWRCRGKAIAVSPTGGEDVAAAGRFTLRRVQQPVRAAGNVSSAAGGDAADLASAVDNTVAPPVVAPR